MRYLPHTEQDIQAMLKVIGADSLDGLFATIPKSCWREEALDLPAPLSEGDDEEAAAACNDLPETGSLEEVEKATILRTLEAAGGNKSEAARRLGITRKTLLSKLNKYQQS